MRPDLEWNRHTPSNRSETAVAHCRFNCERLGIHAPAWCAPRDTAAENRIAAITREIVRLHAAQLEQIRRDHRERERAERALLAGDSGRGAGARDADQGAARGGLVDRSGGVEGDRLADGSAAA